MLLITKRPFICYLSVSYVYWPLLGSLYLFFGKSTMFIVYYPKHFSASRPQILQFRYHWCLDCSLHSCSCPWQTSVPMCLSLSVQCSLDQSPLLPLLLLRASWSHTAILITDNWTISGISASRVPPNGRYFYSQLCSPESHSRNICLLFTAVGISGKWLPSKHNFKKSLN